MRPRHVKSKEQGEVYITDGINSRRDRATKGKGLNLAILCFLKLSQNIKEGNGITA